MNETTGVGLIVALVGGVILLNILGADLQEEVAKARQNQMNMAVPSLPVAAPFPPGFEGWGEDAARAQQEQARFWQEQQEQARQWQEQLRAIAAEQARHNKPPQLRRQPGMPGWRP
jgi:hypothetical protein